MPAPTTLLDESSFAGKSLEQGISNIRKEVIALGAESGQSFGDINKALFDFQSATGAGAESIIGLRAASNLAVAGATNISTAVNGITSVLNSFNLEVAKSQEVSEAFFTAQKFGKTTVEELAQGFGRVAPLAKELGISYEELLAATSAVTLSGQQTSEVYIVFHNFISFLNAWSIASLKSL